MIDLNALGERSIMIDCDVLQADGGTRTASITGACVALKLAVARLEAQGKLDSKKVLTDTVSAVSVGICGGEVLVDLDYEEDSSCEVDMNFVITGDDLFVEIQGTAERGAFSAAQMDAMRAGALEATRALRGIQEQALKNAL
jgi:ribonuclease PH